MSRLICSTTTSLFMMGAALSVSMSLCFINRMNNVIILWKLIIRVSYVLESWIRNVIRNNLRFVFSLMNLLFPCFTSTGKIYLSWFTFNKQREEEFCSIYCFNLIFSSSCPAGHTHTCTDSWFMRLTHDSKSKNTKEKRFGLFVLISRHVTTARINH